MLIFINCSTKKEKSKEAISIDTGAILGLGRTIVNKYRKKRYQDLDKIIKEKINEGEGEKEGKDES